MSLPIGLYFGWPAGAVWSNLLASVICVAVAWWRLRARMIAQHLERLAQAERHHADLRAQADAHHEAALAHAERRHHLAMEHEGILHSHLKSHVTAVGSHVLTAAVPVPQRLLDDIRNAPKAGGGPS